MTQRIIPLPHPPFTLNAPELRPTMLVCLAHPDDESFGMGGTLAAYSAAGASVHLICATGGEEGTVDPEYLHGYQNIAERRYAELRQAAEILGLAELILFGYRDSGMAGSSANHHPEALHAAPLDEVAARVTHEIRRLRPQVVVTFDPIGGYRHPDHIAIHKATVEAFYAAGDPSRYPSDLPPHRPQRLFYTTFSRRLLRTMVGVMRVMGKDPSRMGRNQDVDFASLAEVDFPIHAQVDVQAVLDQRIAASACHASQGGGTLFNRGVAGLILRLLGPRDSFMQAYPEVPADYRVDDLFAGVTISG